MWIGENGQIGAVDVEAHQADVSGLAEIDGRVDDPAVGQNIGGEIRSGGVGDSELVGTVQVGGVKGRQLPAGSPAHEIGHAAGRGLVVEVEERADPERCEDVTRIVRDHDSVPFLQIHSPDLPPVGV